MRLTRTFMTTRQAVINNPKGIHVRPAGCIVAAVNGYAGNITLHTASRPNPVPPTVLSILTLGLSCGSTVDISVAGHDEVTVCQKLAELFSQIYDY